MFGLSFSLPFSLLAIWGICLILVFNYAWHRQRLTDLMPSLSWLGFIIVPYFVTIYPFASDQEALAYQVTGFTIFAYALLAADFFALKRLKTQDKINKSLNRDMKLKKSIRKLDSEGRFLFFCALASIGICLIGIICHLYRVGFENIPLFQKLFADHFSYAEVERLRDSFSREASITFFEKYFYNFNVLVFGLPPLAYFLVTRRFVLMSIFFIIFSTYLVSSTANMPFMIFLSALLLIVLHAVFPKHRNHIIAAGLLIVLIICTLGSYIRMQYPHSFINEALKGKEMGCEHYLDQSPNFCDLDATMGDHYRLPLYRNIDRPTLVRLYDYGTYRMIITPVDVSYRWYQYFKETENRISFASILPPLRDADFIHPARQVTLFAYQSRFPQEYNGFAYGSIDADAFARKGLWGVALISFLLMIVRLIPSYFHSNHAYSEIYNLMIIALLVILMPSASLHAILVAHGVGVICAIIICFRAYKYVQNIRFEREQKSNTITSK